jgi:hypothetical protein
MHRAIVNIPQTGSYTLYSAQIVRLVNPIFRAAGSSPAGLAHLPHCSGYTVRIVETKRRKPRREWLDLTTGIEGGERLGSNRLNVDKRVHVIRPGGFFPGS